MGFAAIKIAPGTASAGRDRARASSSARLGVVRDALAPVGTVFVRGELWTRPLNDEPLRPRRRAFEVDSIDDELVLGVEPASSRFRSHRIRAPWPP